MAAKVETRQGIVEGYEKHGLAIFKGIPYARPPVGKLRFCAPEPPEPWAGVREATRWGHACPQPKVPMLNVGRFDEDCLVLNVWTPGCDRDKRPVMVWVHGGAYLVGSTAQGEYNAKFLAMNGDVVVVTLNYRLGSLGFLDLPAVLGERFEVSANNGIRDQIAALEWVRDNIEAFGGDPSDVTVFGESAGAMSVTTLLATPRAHGLFQRAILQSGAGHHYLEREAGAIVAERLLDALGIDARQPERLWELDAETIVKAQAPVQRKAVAIGPSGLPMVGMPFVPSVDGELLPRGIYGALADGAARDIPVILGTTRDEFRLFTVMASLSSGLSGGGVVPKLTDADLGEIVEKMVPGRGEELIAFYRKLLPGKSPQSIYTAIETDRTFVGPAMRLADALCRHNPRTYFYRIDFSGTALGACHAIDLPLVFGGVDNAFGRMMTGGGPRARALSHKMQNAWLAFAESGQPEGAGLRHWPAYEPKERATMIFDDNCHVVSDPARERRELWSRIF